MEYERKPAGEQTPAYITQHKSDSVDEVVMPESEPFGTSVKSELPVLLGQGDKMTKTFDPKEQK
jgi:hypothetical protein